jgi:hypothetical protein
MPALIFVNTNPYEAEDHITADDIRKVVEAPKEWPVYVKGLPGNEDVRLKEGVSYFVNEMTEFLCHPEECD